MQQNKYRFLRPLQTSKKANQKTAEGGFLVSQQAYKPNSVPRPERGDNHLSKRATFHRSSTYSAVLLVCSCTWVRIWPFHLWYCYQSSPTRGAVTLSNFSVTVRTSQITLDGRYPLPF